MDYLIAKCQYCSRIISNLNILSKHVTVSDLVESILHDEHNGSHLVKMLVRDSLLFYIDKFDKNESLSFRISETFPTHQLQSFGRQFEKETAILLPTVVMTKSTFIKAILVNSIIAVPLLILIFTHEIFAAVFLAYISPIMILALSATIWTILIRKFPGKFYIFEFSGITWFDELMEQTIKKNQATWDKEKIVSLVCLLNDKYKISQKGSM